VVVASRRPSIKSCITVNRAGFQRSRVRHYDLELVPGDASTLELLCAVCTDLEVRDLSRERGFDPKILERMMHLLDMLDALTVPGIPYLHRRKTRLAIKVSDTLPGSTICSAPGDGETGRDAVGPSPGPCQPPTLWPNGVIADDHAVTLPQEGVNCGTRMNETHR